MFASYAELIDIQDAFIQIRIAGPNAFSYMFPR